MRHSIEPTEVVYLRFYLKLSPNWSWTGKPYGPHLLHFMTTENDKYHGPAASHLTLYIEPVNGKLRLATQDIQNKDMPHGLTQGPLRGGYNGQLFDSQDVLFDDGKWHCVEAMFKLNSLDMARDKPNHDGELRGWVDGKLVIEATDVVFRSTDFPEDEVQPVHDAALLPRRRAARPDALDRRTGGGDKADWSMINTILDACQYVLEDQGEAQSSYWLSSLMMEMKLWRASESQVRRALDKDITTFGDSSPFVKVAEDLYALRSWKGRSSGE